MSSKGIYTALSGAIAQNERVETIANNIANVNTPAFKRDQQVFKEYLASYEKSPTTLKVPRVPASIESFYDMQGGDKSFVDTAGTHTDFSQGGMKQTGNDLDIALEGKGFFEVLSPQGQVKYSRSGSLRVDGQGRLTTPDGFFVLREGGGDPQSRTIQLSSSPVSFSNTGGIYQNGESVGRLALVSIEPAQALQKMGASLYSINNNIANIVEPNSTVQVHQGALETSNVNIVQEMTDMISATRTFESTQRAIKAYDSMSEKLVNIVPRPE